METRSVHGFPCVGIQYFSMEKVKDVLVHNLGARPAIVKVAVFNGMCCFMFYTLLSNPGPIFTNCLSPTFRICFK